ncbi:hypothetical protein L7F22_033177 [Adiantum nelumboides]|nr:hypothetical protein [Adiantum nelumboides]
MGANYHEEEGYEGYCVVSLPKKVTEIEDARNKSASGLFEDVASCCILITNSFLDKLASLPFPLGTIMEAVQEVVMPIVHPVEGFTLRLLTTLDDQIYGIVVGIEGSITSAWEKVNHVVKLLGERGILGMSADSWVQNESSIREALQRMIDFVNDIPLIGVATPFLCTISAPLVNSISDWLVEHSQSQDKTIQFHHKEGMKLLDKSEAETGGDFGGVNDVKDIGRDEGTKAVKAEEEAEEGNTEKGAKEEEIVETKDKEVTDKENDAREVTAVLEMIDSGWLLGSAGAVSPRAHDVAPSKPSANSKKQAGSKSKRNILRR